jgi:hypothetical protein
VLALAWIYGMNRFCRWAAKDKNLKAPGAYFDVNKMFSLKLQ